MSSVSSSTSSSSSRKRVTFTDEDVVVPLTLPALPEAVSEPERPETTSHSTASTAPAAGVYTPPSKSNSPTSLLSDAEVLPQAKELDTYEPRNIVLHPCLTISNPAQWDMLIDPQIPPRPDALEEFGQDLITYDLFADSISEMRIICDILPWSIIIDIKQSGLGRSPRTEDITNSIYASLRKLASSVDFNNQTTERQRRIQRAYRRRCHRFSIPDETDGLRRIDFLEGQTMFLGLSPGSRHDEWHLLVGQEY